MSLDKLILLNTFWRGLLFQPDLVCAECFCEGGEDKRIPLLRDIFDAFPNTPVNIDIKVNNDTLIKKVRLSPPLLVLRLITGFF